MSLQTEIAPQSYQAKIAQEHRDRRIRWASKAVTDAGIDLRRNRRVIEPSVEIIAPEAVPVAPEKTVEQTFKRDWLLLNFKPIKENSYPVNIIRFIIALVAKESNITALEIRSARRTKRLVLPRHTAMYLSKELTPKSYPEICRHFGDRDHTVGIYAVDKIGRLMRSDVGLCQFVADMIVQIEQYIADWRSTASIDEAIAALRKSA